MTAQLSSNHLSPPLAESFRQASDAPKPRKAKRPSPMTLRLTPEERAKLEELAQGMTLSAYIRACVLQDGIAPRRASKRAPVQNEQELAQILGLLGQSRIANNLNQLTKEANCGALLVDEQTGREINEAYGYVVEMRGLLLNALGLKDASRR